MSESSESSEAYRRLIAEVYELAGRSRSTSDEFSRRHGQSVARWHVLSVLLDGPHTVPDIADRLGLRRQSIQRVVNDLHDDGLVAFALNPHHARSQLVRISDGGAQIATALFEESAEARSRTLAAAGVTASEMESARRTLERLNVALAETRGESLETRSSGTDRAAGSRASEADGGGGQL